MTRTWQWLGFSALLTLGATALPAPAQKTGEEKEVDQIKAIRIVLDEMNKSLDKAFKKVDEDISGLKNDVKKLDDTNKLGLLKLQLQMQDTLLKMEELKRQVFDLQAEVDRLKKTGGRISLFPPEKTLEERVTKLEKDMAQMQATNRTAFSAPPETGSLVVENRYPEEILFVVNGSAYRMAPGSQLRVDNLPVGKVLCEVISSHGSQVTERQITARQPKQLVIR
jgi:polyhydroxyalkanoate synthesis regulator phasin